MAAKKKASDDLEPLAPLDPMLTRCFQVLQELYTSPTLSLRDWESRRRRAKRPNPNLVSDLLRELEPLVGG